MDLPEHHQLRVIGFLTLYVSSKTGNTVSYPHSTFRFGTPNSLYG